MAFPKCTAYGPLLKHGLTKAIIMKKLSSAVIEGRAIPALRRRCRGRRGRRGRPHARDEEYWCIAVVQVASVAKIALGRASARTSHTMAWPLVVNTRTHHRTLVQETQVARGDAIAGLT